MVRMTPDRVLSKNEDLCKFVLFGLFLTLGVMEIIKTSSSMIHFVLTYINFTSAFFYCIILLERDHKYIFNYPIAM